MTTPASLPRGLSWEEFLALPDLPDYRHAELIDGEVVVNPPARCTSRSSVACGA